MSISDFINKAEKRKVKSKEIPEKKIEDTFVRYARSKGCKALKLILLGLKGWPDRSVLCPGGRILFIEFKKKGGKQTDTQKDWQNIIEGLGFKYYICDEIGQAESILNNFLKK